MAKLKGGFLSREEMKFVFASKDKKTPEEIAKILNRGQKQIRDLISNGIPEDMKGLVNLKKEGEKYEITNTLRQTIEWQRLLKEFTTEELKLFEEKFVKLMVQFSNNVLPSEETQILLSIKLEILMSRNLIDRRRSLEDIARIEKTIEAFVQQHKESGILTDSDRDFVVNMEAQLQAARAAQQACTNEYQKLHAEYQKLMKDMKATREQRIKQVEDGKVSFLGFIKMLQDNDVQETHGREAALMKMSGEKAMKDLSKPFKFADGNMDLPILSVDTIGEESDGSDDVQEGD